MITSAIIVVTMLVAAWFVNRDEPDLVDRIMATAIMFTMAVMVPILVGGAWFVISLFAKELGLP